MLSVILIIKVKSLKDGWNCLMKAINQIYNLIINNNALDLITKLDLSKIMNNYLECEFAKGLDEKIVIDYSSLIIDSS